MKPAGAFRMRLSSVLCVFGRHKVGERQIWNGGYCFGRCDRCQRDLVRTVLQDWRVPKGFRVRWPSETETQPDASVPAQTAARPEPQLTWGMPSPARRPDFMDDTGGVDDWVATIRRVPPVQIQFPDFSDVPQQSAEPRKAASAAPRFP